LLLLLGVAVAELVTLAVAVQGDIGRAFLEKVLVVAHQQKQHYHFQLVLITQLLWEAGGRLILVDQILF
jgi:hypothetical protein